MKKIYYIILYINIFSTLYSWDTVIDKKDIVFIKSDSGYELFIRAKPEISSILLTEAQKWPDNTQPNYGLRTEIYYEANSDQKRILDGKVLSTRYDAFFLIDSTPKKHELLENAYRFFLPEKVIFGYDWTKNGEVEIKPGTRINLRLFEKPYADYEGRFKDQWIILELFVSETKYNHQLIRDMEKLTSLRKGKNFILRENDNPEDFFKKNILDNISISPLHDIVFLIDTTHSMHKLLPSFQKSFPEILKEIDKKVRNYRIAFIYYRDYGERYVTRISHFSNDKDALIKELSSMRVQGGQDIPEAMNEAIYDLRKLDFRKNSRRTAFIIADAPAHSEPRGEVTHQMALETLEELNIKINALCLPFR